MTIHTKDLENKWFYRFVKVMYVFSLLIGLILIILIEWDSKPRKVIDNHKSYLTCPDGAKHTFESLNIQFDYSIPFYNDDDAKKTLLECNKNLKKGDKITDKAALKWINANKHWISSFHDPYPSHWFYKTKGSWHSFAFAILFEFIITFMILNILKQTILYILYGKKINLSF